MNTRNIITQVRERLDAIREKVLELGRSLLLEDSRLFKVNLKGAVDLVTEHDLRIESALNTALSKLFPGDELIFEEGSRRSGDSAFTWVIDPIDGTTNFSTGLPHFCISVGLCYAQRPVAGLIYDPSKDHLFEGIVGDGLWLNQSLQSVSDTKLLDHALLATGFAYDRRVRDDNNVPEMDYMLRRCRGIRRMGAAALDLAYVSVGWLDGYWEYRLKPWDFAAGWACVLAGGGKYTQLDGGAASMDDFNVCATNGVFHEELISALNESPRIFGTT